MREVSGAWIKGLFGLAVIFHLASLSLALSNHSWLIDDSVQYLTLADNMADHGVFSQSIRGEVVPDAQRTPGYPVFLLLLGKSPFLVLLLQHFLLFAAAGLLFSALKQWFSYKVSAFSALLFLIQPYQVIFGSLFLAESLFVFLSICAFWAFSNFAFRKSQIDKTSLVEGQRDGANGRVIKGITLSLFFLALATYVKPVGLVMFFPLAGLVVWEGWRKGTGRNKEIAWISLGLVIMIPSLTLSPWMLRNEAITGKFTFSVMGEMGMLHGRLGGLEALKNHENFDEHNLYMRGDSTAALFLGLANIKTYPSSKQTHETALYNPASNGMTIRHFIHNPIAGICFQIITLYQMLSGLGYGWAAKVYHSHGLAFFSALIQGLFNLLMYGALLIGLFSIRKWPLINWLATGWILIVLWASSSAWADGRYRMVIDPFLMVLVAFVLEKWCSDKWCSWDKIV